MRLEPVKLVKTPKKLVDKIVSTNFPELLKLLRQNYSNQLRIGKSKFQKTPHCYETFLFTWDELENCIFLSQVFEFVAFMYKRHKSPSKDIGLRPQIIHYPAAYGCLGSHFHDNSEQKIGAICVLYSSRQTGAFYIEKEKQIYFPNEQVGDTIIFDFGLTHGVLSDTNLPMEILEKKDAEKYVDINNLGRIVAVLTSE